MQKIEVKNLSLDQRNGLALEIIPAKYQTAEDGSCITLYQEPLYYSTSLDVNDWKRVILILRDRYFHSPSSVHIKKISTLKPETLITLF